MTFAKPERFNNDPLPEIVVRPRLVKPSKPSISRRSWLFEIVTLPLTEVSDDNPDNEDKRVLETFRLPEIVVSLANDKLEMFGFNANKPPSIRSNASAENPPKR